MHVVFGFVDVFNDDMNHPEPYLFRDWMIHKFNKINNKNLLGRSITRHHRGGPKECSVITLTLAQSEPPTWWHPRVQQVSPSHHSQLHALKVAVCQQGRECLAQTTL